VESAHGRWDIYRDVPGTKGFLRKKTNITSKRLTTIHAAAEGRTVTVGTLKQVRQACNLTAVDGVDSNSFYDATDIIDAYVNEYRQTISRLAKT
jgi:hypothetical protein